MNYSYLFGKYIPEKCVLLIVSVVKWLKYWGCGALVGEWYTKSTQDLFQTPIFLLEKFIVFVRDFLCKFLIVFNAPFIDFIKNWFHFQSCIR